MEHSALAKLYARHVQEGKRTIDSVPSKIRDEVIEILGDES